MRGGRVHPQPEDLRCRCAVSGPGRRPADLFYPEDSFVATTGADIKESGSNLTSAPFYGTSVLFVVFQTLMNPLLHVLCRHVHVSLKVAATADGVP